MTTLNSINQAIDDAVLTAIEGGCVRAAEIESRVFGDVVHSDKVMRAIDKALQRLKRANKIAFTRKAGWTVVGGNQ